MENNNPFKFTGTILRVLDGEAVCYHGFNQRLADLYLSEKPGRRLEVAGVLQLTSQEVVGVIEVLAECRRFQAEQHLRRALEFARSANDQGVTSVRQYAKVG